MKTRLYYVDAARCFACLLVVTSHVFAPICASFNFTPLPVWWLVNLFDSIIRPAAALYVMISGVLFLGSTREEPYFTFVWKRYTKLLPPFLTWSLIYALFNAYGQEEPFHLGHTLFQILYTPTAYHLWFMYMILALYLVMPPLKHFVRTARPATLVLFLTVWLGFLTVRFFVPSFLGDRFIATVLSYGGYAVLGVILAKTDVLQKTAKPWIYLWVTIILFNAVGTYWLTVQNGGVLDERLYFGAAPLVAIQSAAMFILLKKCDHDSWLYKNVGVRSIVKHLSRHSYDIYLNHALLITLFAGLFSSLDVSRHLESGALTSVCLSSIIVLASSLGLSILLSKTPILSKFLVLSPSPKAATAPSEQDN